VTLIEIMFALTIMSVGLIALAGLMYQVARQTHASTSASYRSTALQRAGSWMESVPWDEIPGATGCSIDTIGVLSYSNCVSYLQSAPGLRKLQVVVAPQGDFISRPETLVVYRHQGLLLSPFQ
jgi:type II secretory pathway pseudopilin PulG